MSISNRDLKTYVKVQKYKKEKGYGEVYNLREAIKKMPTLKKEYPENDTVDRLNLSHKLSRRKRQIKKGYISILGSENQMIGYEPKRNIFGNTWGKRGFNALDDEIRKLILAEEPLKKHLRRLQQKYNLSKKDDKGIIKDMWNWIAKDYEDMSSEELKAEREWNARPIKVIKIRPLIKSKKNKKEIPQTFRENMASPKNRDLKETALSLGDLSRQQIREWKEFKASLKDSNR